MSTGLALRSATALSEWSTIREQASILVKTGFLPSSIKTPEQAMAIILTGRELGIGTMAALNTINVIQGKPTISPQLMLALINSSRQLEDIKIESTDKGATCTIKRQGRAPYTARFGPAEAQAMQLASKDNYKKQPATMYRWRAIADAARATFPDVILGLYTHEEMGAPVNADGEVIEGADVTVDALSSLEAAPSAPSVTLTPRQREILAAMETIYVANVKPGVVADWPGVRAGLVGLSEAELEKRLVAWQKADLERRAKASPVIEDEPIEAEPVESDEAAF